MVSLPPNWTSEVGTEAGGTYTTRRLPICNQQTLAEMEAQGVPRCCSAILAPICSVGIVAPLFRR